jgi:hypothetical protein
MTDPADEQRVWLRAILERLKIAPTALAQKAGLAQPTITRFLNDKTATHALSARTIAAIKRASGMTYGPDPRPVGARDREAIPFSPKSSGDVADMVRAAIAGRNAIDPWTMHSRALETAGYIPGDVMIVDLNATPQPGDVVCAQLYDWARSNAQTVFRLWEPPYLTPATHDPKLRQIYPVDNHNVVMKGVVMATIRPRQARAA